MSPGLRMGGWGYRAYILDRIASERRYMVNNREQAILKIVDFLKSDRRILLLTGTYQNEKHKLVLREIANAISLNTNIV